MSKFMCDLPWVHLSLFPHGTSSICCEANHDKSMGHSYNVGKNGSIDLIGIKDHSIDEIVNSDNYKQIRREMIEGKIPDACMGCKRIEDGGGSSKRIKDSYWKEDWASITNEDGSITPDIRSVELRLGNYCNLKCRSCNAESSTSWIKEYDKFKHSLPLPSAYDDIRTDSRYSFSWPESDDFYEDLESHIANIEEIHISGGEPFLVPKHFRLFELLESKNMYDVNIGYHTNLNYDLDKIMPHLETLNNFKNVRLNLSIDDVSERNTYIRNPSNWDLTIKNLKLLIERLPNVRLLICQTVNAYNFMYIEELYLFLKENNISLYHYYNHVHSPDYQTAYIIPSEVRKKKIDTIRDVLPENLFNDIHGRYYNEIEKTDQIHTFNSFTRALDISRNETFDILFPELNQVLTTYIQGKLEC